MQKNDKTKLNLQLFFAESDGAVSSNSGEIFSVDAEQNGELKKALPNDEFETLIDGKFKEQFTKKVQSIIDKRFKETKELEEYKKNVSPIIEKLNEKYDLNEDNFQLLNELIFNNSENADYVNNSKSDFDESLKQQVFSWVKEGENLKELYPDFDFKNEIKSNPLFAKLLHTGVPLKSAYELIHKDEILSGAMAYTAEKVREQLVKGIAAKGQRPTENGIMAESGIVTVTDVNALTKKDILKILKQVEGGANVKF